LLPVVLHWWKIEATFLSTGSKEVVVAFELSHSISSYGVNTSKLKGIEP
jgi:hypothetical protein